MSKNVEMTNQEKMELRTRCGKLMIPAQLISQEPELMLRVMGECIVVRAEYLAMYNIFEYHVYSPLLPILDEGTVTPEYNVQFDIEADKITFTLVE